MSETPTATAAAFAELRAAAGDDLEVPTGDASDDMFVAILNEADETGELARKVGRTRAEVLVGPRVHEFGGDALRFLKEAGAVMFEGRTNYGASSVELAPKKAVLRVVAPEHVARKIGDAPNKAPLLVAAFLERAVELIAGEPHAPRYLGHAPRIDSRFDRPMVNLIFEFDLDE